MASRGTVTLVNVTGLAVWVETPSGRVERARHGKPVHVTPHVFHTQLEDSGTVLQGVLVQVTNGKRVVQDNPNIVLDAEIRSYLKGVKEGRVSLAEAETLILSITSSYTLHRYGRIAHQLDLPASLADSQTGLLARRKADLEAEHFREGQISQERQRRLGQGVATQRSA